MQCVPIAKGGEAAEHKGECPEMLRVQEESGGSGHSEETYKKTRGKCRDIAPTETHRVANLC